MTDLIDNPDNPRRTLSTDALYELNTWLTQFLGIHAGWEAITDDDDDRLNDLTLAVGALITDHLDASDAARAGAEPSVSRINDGDDL